MSFWSRACARLHRSFPHRLVEEVQVLIVVVVSPLPLEIPADYFAALEEETFPPRS